MSVKPFDARRAFSTLAWMALVVWLPSCGGGGGTCPNPADSTCPTPSPTPSPTSTPPVVVAQGGGTLEAGFIAMVPPIVTTTSGALEVTVDWTFATNNIDIAVTRGSCSFDQLENGQCNVAAFSISATAKPERVRVSGAAAGTYTLFIENTGSRDDSVSYQAVLFPGATSASDAVRSLTLPDQFRQSRHRLIW